jgi:hypothetical protein
MIPFDEIRKEASQRYFGRLFEDVVGYLNLYDYLQLKIMNVRGKSKLASVESFWFSILRDKFAHRYTGSFTPMKSGDYVKLKDVFMTEWAPKLPGQIWTSQGVRVMDELAREYRDTHDPEIPEEIFELARRLKEMEH